MNKRNHHVVSSTPIPGHEAALSLSWPSPITQHNRKDLQLNVKSSKEKKQQFHDSQELTSPTAGSTLEKLKPENFTKLSVIEDTDEEEEEMRAPLKNINNSKPSLEKKRQSIKKQQLNLSFSKSSKQRKEIFVQKNEDATKSEKKTQKSLEPLLEITEECEHDIKDHRETPNGKQNEYSQKNRNTFGKKQNDDSVELDHEIHIKEIKGSLTDEEDEEGILISEGKQKKQSLRKIGCGRLQQHSSSRDTDTVNVQHTAPETELPAVTEDEDVRRVEKSKKLSQENQTVEESNSGNEVHTSTRSRKRSLYSHEKASFTIIEVSVDRNLSKHSACNYPFLEEIDSNPEDITNVQVQKSSGNAKKKLRRTKQPQNITKTKIPSKTAESAPKGKRKFNYTKEDVANLRRSKRTRVKPLAFWIGERLCYKPGPDACFEIVGVEPACGAESICRQRNTTHEHIAFNIPLQNQRNPPLKTVEIINEGRKQEVECFSTLRPVSVAKGFSKYRMLDSSVTEAGLIKLASSTKESFEASSAHFVFFILKGHALVQIQNDTQEVKSGELFQVPKGIPYSVENLSKKEVMLHYVMVK